MAPTPFKLLSASQPGRRSRDVRNTASATRIEFRGRRDGISAAQDVTEGGGGRTRCPTGRISSEKIQMIEKRRKTTYGRGGGTTADSTWKLNYLKRLGGITDRLKTVVRRVTHASTPTHAPTRIRI